MAYYFYGSNSSETIYGTSSHDVIYGYGGNDRLFGGYGNDHLYGGSGDDDLYGGAGINTLYGGYGDDWFIMNARSSASSDDLIADFEFGNDAIDVSAWGVSDFSQIKAILTSYYGDARLNAFAGGYNHVLTIDSVAPSQLVAQDFVYSGGGGRNVVGTAYNDTMFGSRYNDTLNGGNGHDILLGGYGNDILVGSYGNDDLHGGAGYDVMTGGAGYDAFNFDAITELGAQRRTRPHHRLPGGYRLYRPVEDRRQRVCGRQPGVPLHRRACFYGGGTGVLCLLGQQHDHLGQHRHRCGGRIPGHAVRPSRHDRRRLHPLSRAGMKRPPGFRRAAVFSCRGGNRSQQGPSDTTR